MSSGTDFKRLEAVISEAMNRLCGGDPMAVHARSIETGLDESLASRLGEVELERGSRFASHERRIQWAEGQRARMAVLDAFAGQGGGLFGLAHSQGKAGKIAIGVGWIGGANAVGIGVDLEALERATTPRVFDRILRKPERGFGFEPLDLWVIKEACFKAASPAGPKTMTDFEVTEFEPAGGTGRARDVRGLGVQLSFSVFAAEGWRLALALARRS